MATKKETKKQEWEEPKFTKAHILTMTRYIERQDLLSVLLDDSKTYSHKEVESVIAKFMKN